MGDVSLPAWAEQAIGGFPAEYLPDAETIPLQSREQPLTPSGPLQVGPYTLHAQIGAGSAAKVYRATKATNGMTYALKVIDIHSSDEAELRYQREVEIILRLNHHHICPVDDVGRDGRWRYIAMPLLAGTMKQRMVEYGKPFPLHHAASWVIQMCGALDYAHRRGIVHRDVKPHNMLISVGEPNRLQLADFGISRLLNVPGLTATGQAIGTPEYIAPEQAQGEAVDARADIYSLGCVLYHWLAGRPPFHAESPIATVSQHVFYLAEPLCKVNPEMNAGISLIVEKAMMKRPEDRYASAREFAEALGYFEV